MEYLSGSGNGVPGIVWPTAPDVPEPSWPDNLEPALPAPDVDPPAPIGDPCDPAWCVGSLMLTTLLYPLESGDAVSVGMPTFSIGVWSMEQDHAIVEPPRFSGTHVQTLFSTAYSLSDSATVIAPRFSGTHEQTFFPVSYNAGFEAASLAPPVFSGTYVQTLFTLAYNAGTESASLSPPTFSGTLL